MRLQLALNVKDLNAAIDYYSKMFATTPHKVRDGYANFAIEDPALKLVLFENPNATENLNHLGVEMFGPDDIEKNSRRLKAAGVLGSVQSDTVCCHAEQDKIWTDGGENLSWEWYVIKDDAPEKDIPDQSKCCSDLQPQNTACC